MSENWPVPDNEVAAIWMALRITVWENKVTTPSLRAALERVRSEMVRRGLRP